MPQLETATRPLEQFDQRFAGFDTRSRILLGAVTRQLDKRSKLKRELRTASGRKRDFLKAGIAICDNQVAVLESICEKRAIQEHRRLVASAECRDTMTYQ